MPGSRCSRCRRACLPALNGVRVSHGRAGLSGVRVRLRLRLAAGILRASRRAAPCAARLMRQTDAASVRSPMLAVAPSVPYPMTRSCLAANVHPHARAAALLLPGLPLLLHGKGHCKTVAAMDPGAAPSLPGGEVKTPCRAGLLGSVPVRTIHVRERDDFLAQCMPGRLWGYQTAPGAAHWCPALGPRLPGFGLEATYCAIFGAHAKAPICNYCVHTRTRSPVVTRCPFFPARANLTPSPPLILGR